MPLPDVEAERAFAERMNQIADARDRKADLLADPDVPLREAYDAELETLATNFKAQVEFFGGDDYTTMAAAYQRGERDDGLARTATYWMESVLLIEQQIARGGLIYAPIVLRYPDCATVNVRFAIGDPPEDAIICEAPEHAGETLEEQHLETYHAESAYTQREAAAYMRETTELLREEFPHPDDASFEERKYGGIAGISGHHGSTFSVYTRRVQPNAERFENAPEEVCVVPEGPEAKQTERDLLADATLVV